MLQTRGVRFTASETERKKDLHSIITIAFLSIYLTGWAFVSALYPEAFNAFDLRVLSIVSVMASISLLVISLFDYAAGRAVQSEKLLQNALMISPLAREMERQLVSPNPNVKRLGDIASEYEHLIANTGVNHTSADYRLWAFEKRQPSNCIERLLLPPMKMVRRSLLFMYSAIFQLCIIIVVLMATVWLAVNVFSVAPH
ncbi:SLATT domain-containing protein [Mesorhizobium sp. 113-3-9]